MITVTEEWRPVVGCEGFYEVSNLGVVRRTAPGPRTYPGKITLQKTNPRGYSIVTLCCGSLKPPATVTTHRVVAEAFLGPRPLGLQVNHKDGDKSNNRLDNLEYVTPSENIRHAVEHGLMNFDNLVAAGRRVGQLQTSKLTPEDVRYIRKCSETALQLANRFGVSKSAIKSARKGRTWKSVGD